MPPSLNCRNWIMAPKSIGQFDDYTKDPILWVASSNRFFATILRPLPSTPSPALFELVDSRKIPQVTHIASGNVDVIKMVKTKPAKRPGHRQADRVRGGCGGNTLVTEPLSAYMGPKKREILDGKYGAAPGTWRSMPIAFMTTSVRFSCLKGVDLFLFMTTWS